MKNTEKGITHLEATLDRIEEDKAVLQIKDGGDFVIDKKYLPKEAKEGEIVVVTFATNQAETDRREKKAREILNEILGNSTTK
ncbi:MAG: DUF3006 domain-containing protein [Candidatus Berkelbacteria bacterium]